MRAAGWRKGESNWFGEKWEPRVWGKKQRAWERMVTTGLRENGSSGEDAEGFVMLPKW
jgi:hypothetical protein